MVKLPIYMDHHATTPVDPRVLEAMIPFFTEHFGNSASKNHIFGDTASQAVEESRKTIAECIGAEPREIIFTSGATESNNLALQGTAFASTKKKHLISVTTEHKSVLDCLSFLETRGFEVTYLPVDSEGMLDPSQVQLAIREDTLLASVMLANNEIGVLQPLQEIAKVCSQRGVLLHSDVTQAVGKIPFNIRLLGVDLASFNAHKLYGPKGIGALYFRRQGPLRAKLQPLLYGGGHERGLRSGTLPTPLIVGFAKACALAMAELPSESERLLLLRDQLWKRLLGAIPKIHLNGSLQHRLPGNLNVSIELVQGEALLLSLKDVALSSGSACTTLDSEPSHVLKAIGRSAELADASLRFGLGRGNTEEEVEWVVHNTAEQVKQLRTVSSGWSG